MRKLVVGLVALLLLVGLVSAVSIEKFSVRAFGGNLEKLGDDTVFNWHKAYFGANGRITTHGLVGVGSVRIIALDENNVPIVLLLRLKPINVEEYSEERIYVDNEGFGTYWKRGSVPVRVHLDSVKYDIDKVAGTVNIVGVGDIEFTINGLEIKLLQ